MCFSGTLPGSAPSSCVPATRSPVCSHDVYNNGERQSNFTRHGSPLSTPLLRHVWKETRLKTAPSSCWEQREEPGGASRRASVTLHKHRCYICLLLLYSDTRTRDPRDRHDKFQKTSNVTASAPSVHFLFRGGVFELVWDEWRSVRSLSFLVLFVYWPTNQHDSGRLVGFMETQMKYLFLDVVIFQMFSRNAWERPLLHSSCTQFLYSGVNGKPNGSPPSSLDPSADTSEESASVNLSTVYCCMLAAQFIRYTSEIWCRHIRDHIGHLWWMSFPLLQELCVKVCVRSEYQLCICR